jgi:type I restriction enzyme M protein
LAYHKFSGVVQGWLTTIEAAFDTEGEESVRDKQRLAAEKRRAREHSAVPLLIPDYLNALEQAEARRADLDAQVKAATAKPAEDEDDADDDVSAETSLSPAELTMLKSDLAAAKKEVKRLEADFLNQLKDKVGQLNPSAEEALVRHILKADLKKRLDAEFSAGPRALADRYRTWADKYAIPLLDLEARRSMAEARFSAYLKDLGYA